MAIAPPVEPDEPRKVKRPRDPNRPRGLQPRSTSADDPMATPAGLDDPFGSPTDDDTFSVDLTNVKESMGAFNVPAGTYPGRCSDILRETSKAGNPMWRFMFLIKSGPQGGKKLPIFCALTEKAMWKVLEVLSAMDLGQAGTISKFKKADAIGKDVWMIVEEEADDQGRYRGVLSRVVNPRDYDAEMPEGSVEDPDDQDEIPF